MLNLLGKKFNCEEQIRERLAELETLVDDLSIQQGAMQSEIEDLQCELSEIEDEWGDVYPDDVMAEDDRQRAADMNATLRDMMRVTWHYKTGKLWHWIILDRSLADLRTMPAFAGKRSIL